MTDECGDERRPAARRRAARHRSGAATATRAACGRPREAAQEQHERVPRPRTPPRCACPCVSRPRDEEGSTGRRAWRESVGAASSGDGRGHATCDAVTQAATKRATDEPGSLASTVRRSPSSTGTLHSKPRSRRAAVGSARVCRTSPGRGSTCSGGIATPRSCSRISSRSSSDVDVPAATLNARPSHTAAGRGGGELGGGDRVGHVGEVAALAPVAVDDRARVRRGARRRTAG